MFYKKRFARATRDVAKLRNTRALFLYFHCHQKHFIFDDSQNLCNGGTFTSKLIIYNKLLRIFLISLIIMTVTACTILSRDWNSQIYIVKANDTLYSIAWRYNLNYKDVANWNNIKEPYTIFIGQKIILSKPTASNNLAKTPSGSSDSGRHSTKAVNRKPVAVKEDLEPKVWRWPTKGKVIKSFGGANSTSQGIDIVGVVGQKIVAVANGKVVYSGDGLIGYGKLIIVKHNDTFLSAYGHNKILLVKEGEHVRAGQQIAEMGSLNNNDKARLHFELRKFGKPVNPMKYLPKH